jgi:hypothetical protein
MAAKREWGRCAVHTTYPDRNRPSSGYTSPTVGNALYLSNGISENYKLDHWTGRASKINTPAEEIDEAACL